MEPELSRLVGEYLASAEYLALPIDEALAIRRATQRATGFDSLPAKVKAYIESRRSGGQRANPA